MDPRLQFNTSDLKELPMDWKFLSKVTDSFFCNNDIWQSWHSLSANVLSNVCNNIYRRWQCWQKYLPTLLAIIVILYHLPWWRHQPSPIFLMHSNHLPDKAGYCSMFIDLEAWHILHQRKRLLSAQGPTSRSLDRSHLLLFSFFTNIILTSGCYNQGNPRKTSANKPRILSQLDLGTIKKVYLAV